MQKSIQKEAGLVKFLRFCIYLTAFVPLVVFMDFISPFHFSKVLIFRSLVEIMGAAYLILVLKDRSYLPRRDNIFWAFLLFTAVFTLTTITSVLRYPSFWGALERMGGLWTFWHYFLFFIILISVFTKKEHWQKLFNLTILAGVLSAFYGFGQKTNIKFFVGSGGRERIFGTIGNPALFAGYELFTVFLSLIMYLRAGLAKSRPFYLLAFIVSSVAVLMTVVRGSLLGYAIGLTILVFLWMIYKKSRLGKSIFTVLIGSALAFAAFSWLFHDSSLVQKSSYLKRVTDLSLTSTTVQTRFWAWEAGITGWKESPKTILLGWGPENFNIPFSKNFNPKFFRGPGAETLFDRAHNMFVEILVTMGIIGFLAYLNIFAALFSSLRKLLRNPSLLVYGAGFTAAIVAYIIHNSFIFDTSANFIVFFTVAGFISFLGVPENDQGSTSPERGRTLNPAMINLIIAFLIVFIPFLIYKTNVLPAKANYATTRAIVRGWAGDFNGSFEKTKESLSYDVPGKYEYRHRFAQYLVGVGGPSTKEERVQMAYEFAMAEVEKNIKENQVDYLPHLYASRLNIMLGKDNPKSPYNNIALEHSLKALELAPKFVRTYYEVAQAYLNQKDYKHAVEFFQRAADLNPDTGISHAYLGAAKIESGDLSGAEDLERAITSVNSYSPRETDFQRLINAYLKTKDFAKIAWVYEQMIKANPKNPQHYASLATTYVNLGRIEEAVATARKAAQVDPSFEPDARIFLKSIGREL
ncbi:MAG: hypothetical protein G01um101444_212 [Parcubacteria group bacterium Gr01-1014_44]|nr:MAG: hypothetical protein G01um101444_212 [Parcubacteria group bacterium Gr01-1014_44]